jgi:hypothetical protein
MFAPAVRHRSTTTRVAAIGSTLALVMAWMAVTPTSAHAQDPPYDRGISAACSADARGAAIFDDVGTGTHAAAINCLGYLGIALGQQADDGSPVFEPRSDVTREQMASFIARMMDRAFVFPEPSADPFDDVSAAHTDNVERLRAVDVVEGREDGTYGARDRVTREQMASFIARALEASTGETLPSASVFDDPGASVHAPNVEKLAAIGVVEGREDGTYGPREAVSREQMASFIARGMDHLAEQGLYDDEVEPLPGDPTTEPRSQDASDGAAIAVTDVRVASHQGFDRVVFDIEGDGAAGWLVSYQDEPTSPGTGFPIEADGAANLEILIEGAALPDDLPDGIEPVGDDVIVLGGEAIVEIVPDTIFEGLHHVVAGTTGERPFIVGEADGDVVVDVFHAG